MLFTTHFEEAAMKLFGGGASKPARCVNSSDRVLTSKVHCLLVFFVSMLLEFGRVFAAKMFVFRSNVQSVKHGVEILRMELEVGQVLLLRDIESILAV